MTELYKIILTSGFTIFGGIFVYVMGQVISRFFIEPIHEQSRCIGEIANCLIFYAKFYANPGTNKPEDENRASEALRQHASLLISKTHIIRWYILFEFLKFVPKRKVVGEAVIELILLSISVSQGNSSLNNATRQKIVKLLNIKIYG